MHISEPAEYAILGLMKSRPMHGYEMFQQFENGTLGQIVHLEMSQLYAFLKKLERLQYITAQLESKGARPPRRVFQLTEAGQDVFLQWLTQPVEKPRDIRILFLIKLYFIQQWLPAQTGDLVEQPLLIPVHLELEVNAIPHVLEVAPQCVALALQEHVLDLAVVVGVADQLCAFPQSRGLGPDH